jgi:hypothetical protein
MVGLAVRIFPVTTRTFTKDMALPENGRGAERYGRGTAWTRHGICELAFRGLLLHLITLNDTRTHAHTPPSVGLLWTNDRHIAETSTWRQHSQAIDTYTSGGVRTRNPQQASGRRPMPATARRPGSAHTTVTATIIDSRSQWSAGLGHGCEAARFLNLRIWIPPLAWMSVSCECCEVQVSATGRSLVQMIPTEWGVSQCDLNTSTMGKPRSTRAVKPWKKNVIIDSKPQPVPVSGIILLEDRPVQVY